MSYSIYKLVKSILTCRICVNYGPTQGSRTMMASEDLGLNVGAEAGNETQVEASVRCDKGGNVEITQVI